MPEQKYKTKQRDEIICFFMDHEDECFSARDVSRCVSAGEATVFRALSALVSEGKLKRFTSGTGRGDCSYYQYNNCDKCGEHIHLKCENCGRLIHMDCSFMTEIISHFMGEHGFNVDCGKTVIYGLCDQCNKQTENSNA